MRSTVRRGLSAGALALACLLTAAGGAHGATTAASSAFSTAALAAAAPPAGFQESTVWCGLSNPTAIRFADDGRVFVAEQGGLIKVFDNVNDPTATIYADLRSNVHWFWDRGLLGMALDPDFTNGRPYVYVLYTYDARIGQSPPTWGDACPTPPGATGDGCVVSGRLSRLNGPVETVLINDWCQQFPSHSVGSIAFGADGALYASAGDGASFNFADYGQDGNPVNPCGDPASNPSNPTPPSAEGGALRSQDIRIDGRPDGAGRHDHPHQPGHGRRDARQPERGELGREHPPDHRLRPAQPVPLHVPARARTSSTSATSAGTSGRRSTASPARPGPSRTSAGPATRATGGCRATTTPTSTSASPSTPRRPTRHAAALHVQPRREGRRRDLPDRHLVDLRASRSTTAARSRAAYNGALFFADYSRNCIWAMYPDANGVPDPTRARSSSTARPARSTSRSARAATCSTPTSAAARSAASTAHAERRADRRATATPTSGSVR